MHPSDCLEGSHEGGCSCPPSLAAAQGLDELEFERGIWGAALDGDRDKVQRLLQRSRNADAHARDSSGTWPIS